MTPTETFIKYYNPAASYIPQSNIPASVKEETIGVSDRFDLLLRKECEKVSRKNPGNVASIQGYNQYNYMRAQNTLGLLKMLEVEKSMDRVRMTEDDLKKSIEDAESQPVEESPEEQAAEVKTDADVPQTPESNELQATNCNETKVEPEMPAPTSTENES